MAATEAVTYEVRRENLEELIRQRPEVAEEMGRALAVHQLHDAQARSDFSRQEKEEDIRSAADQIFNRMRRFFSFLGAPEEKGAA